VGHGAGGTYGFPKTRFSTTPSWGGMGIQQPRGSTCISLFLSPGDKETTGPRSGGTHRGADHSTGRVESFFFPLIFKPFDGNFEKGSGCPSLRFSGGFFQFFGWNGQRHRGGGGPGKTGPTQGAAEQGFDRRMRRNTHGRDQLQLMDGVPLSFYYNKLGWAEIRDQGMDCEVLMRPTNLKKAFPIDERNDDFGSWLAYGQKTARRCEPRGRATLAPDGRRAGEKASTT